MSQRELLSNQNVYKFCFVPGCKNTTITAPNKVFLSVPNEPVKRKAWCEAAGCPGKSLRAGSHACEDHFDLQQDIENYMWWKITGGNKRLKKDVVPRFAIQNNNLPNPSSSLIRNVSLVNPSCETSQTQNYEKEIRQLSDAENDEFVPISMVIEPITKDESVQVQPDTENKYAEIKPKTLTK